MGAMTAKDLAKQAAEDAVQAFYQEQQKQLKQKIYHNTKYLMENYNRIRQSVEEGISEIEELDLDHDYECLNDLFLSSVRRGKFRSAIMLTHIEKCLGLLKKEQEGKRTVEKYHAFTIHFLEGQTYEKMAELYGYNERTSRRWINEMLDIMGVYLFGVEALQF